MAIVSILLALFVFMVITCVQTFTNKAKVVRNGPGLRLTMSHTDSEPVSSVEATAKGLLRTGGIAASLLVASQQAQAAQTGLRQGLYDPDVGAGGTALPVDAEAAAKVDYKSFKLPYDHQNIALSQFIGDNKATILFNMKIDDSQTQLQFPSLGEIYRKYKAQGLGVLAFPSEQGWFEPDDDETIREKSKVFYNFGDPPNCAVFDKIDFLGPSAHPLHSVLTKNFPTPNGYGRITLNYEKFLLDATGKPVRRYPRKFSAYDMEADIAALLKGEQLPEESEQFKKAWREAKREAVKSEYAFKYNLNYYTAPDSMYRYKETGSEA